MATPTATMINGIIFLRPFLARVIEYEGSVFLSVVIAVLSIVITALSVVIKVTSPFVTGIMIPVTW
ncbi:hypothetical protein CEQ20_19310 [Yersinia pseudotuberculosis]|nr:hypothetical protein CEQ20_19310 [Yersinia pseudotuberculosis]AYX10974.1 hypothetical protein EGX52_09360 [Yersinia pseudotuberculosis]MBO1567935.1 hypothetical protein [Yersinia pseudotuberculosis]MBO1590943.1 hypothetical protein [Yersinia pseudotuberculosis]MBO1604764.1 hypothetical protein [Yersinia pseudotuberculosis]